jgi:hypothetical protein
MEHHVEVIADLNLNGMWTGLCRCGYMTGDGSQEEADREAREHLANPEPSKLDPWHPGKHPTPDG